MAILNRRAFVGLATVTVVAPSLVKAGESGAKARLHTVEITGFKFVPATLTVRPGDRILWINRDIAPHTATATDDSWDTGSLKKDERTTTDVSEGFTGEYYCRFHPHMKGSLTLLND